MWTDFVLKIYSFLFAVIMLFCGMEVSLPQVRESVGVAYSFADTQSGRAAGTVTLTAKMPGEYDLYWGNAKKERLDVGGTPVSEFAEVTVSDGTGSSQIYEYTAIPEGAKTVLAFSGPVLLGSCEIPQNKQASNGKPLYSFGALSDVHFDRYNMSLTGDDAVLAFTNALDFLKEKNVSLVALSGDISTKSETDAFEKYNDITGKYDFPVYTCTGNHDVGYGEFTDRWRRLINTDAYNAPVRDGITVAPNGIDFVYAPSKLGGDVFVFLSQLYWDYNNSSSRLLENSQLDWLEATFEKYKGRRVYLFFHTFMADDKGNPHLGEGNLLNDRGVTYDLVYTVGTGDEVRLRALLQKYKNVIFFNGHSHWEFEGASMNPIMNVTDYAGKYATLVHIPSVSSPRRTEPGATGRKELFMRSSQGYLVNVYSDKIVLYGIQFWGSTYLGYATFVINR